jgi:hypothetical protein
MRGRYLLVMMMTAVLVSCKKGKVTISPQPTAPMVLLKEIVIPLLPSPYYHFEYNAEGKPSFVSFASELYRYDVVYDGDRINEMRNNIIVNKDRLQYFYDNAGRVFLIKYADSTGVVKQRSFFTYDGQKLVKIERDHKTDGGFIIDRTMTMTYYADGNLLELAIHRPPIAGQSESNYVNRFEQYDNKINTDAFGLLHEEFFEHLILLPGIQLQKNNPGKEIRTGDGINYKVEYTYSYNDKNVPLTKTGEATVLNGADAGQKFQTNSMYTYY